jgi:hypothetical protein
LISVNSFSCKCCSFPVGTLHLVTVYTAVCTYAYALCSDNAVCLLGSCIPPYQSIN